MIVACQRGDDTCCLVFDLADVNNHDPILILSIVGGVSAAVSKTAAAPIERVKLLIQNQVSRSLI